MSETKQVAVLVGSLRKESFNRKLARAIEKLAPAGWTFDHIRIDAVPLYDQDNDANPPETVKALKAAIESADAFLFVSPEYNRSIPGVLKNAIDTASRPYGKSSFGAKPAGVIGVSVGAIGTALAQQHLRNVLAYLNLPTLGQPEAFLQFKDGLIADDGTISDDGTRKFLQTWVDAYAAWVKTHSAA